MAERSVIIVGGGVIGAAMLHELALRGVCATLIEAETGIGLGTSYANGGMQTASMPDPWNGPGVGKHLIASLFDPRSAMKLRAAAIPGMIGWGLRFLACSTAARHRAATRANYALCAYSVARTEALHADCDFDYDRSDAGAMKIFETAAAMQGPLAIAEDLGGFGLRFERLSADDAVAREPQLAAMRARMAGALYFPDDRVGDARKFAVEAARRAGLLGANVVTGTRVDRLIVRNGRVIGAAAGDRAWHGDVVLAAGGDGAALARPVGVSLPIRPAKGYSLTVDADALGKDMPRIAVIDDAMHAALVPIGNRLRLAGTAEFAGRDHRIDPVRIANLVALLRRVYPHLADRVDVEAGEPWVGLRPMSADGKPIIGPSPVEGLWLNCGHGHLGWTMAAGSASILADRMLGKSPEIDAAPFLLQR